MAKSSCSQPRRDIREMNAALKTGLLEASLHDVRHVFADALAYFRDTYPYGCHLPTQVYRFPTYCSRARSGTWNLSASSRLWAPSPGASASAIMCRGHSAKNCYSKGLCRGGQGSGTLSTHSSTTQNWPSPSTPCHLSFFLCRSAERYRLPTPRSSYSPEGPSRREQGLPS